MGLKSKRFGGETMSYNAYSDEYGIYIQTDDGLKTLNDFIRSVRLNHRYYFGGTVDYHA